MKRKGSGDGEGHDRGPSQRQRHQPKQPRLERNTEGLHVLLSTLRCAHSGCTPPLNYMYSALAVITDQLWIGDPVLLWRLMI